MYLRLGMDGMTARHSGSPALLRGPGSNKVVPWHTPAARLVPCTGAGVCAAALRAASSLARACAGRLCAAPGCRRRCAALTLCGAAPHGRVRDALSLLSLPAEALPSDGHASYSSYTRSSTRLSSIWLGSAHARRCAHGCMMHDGPAPSAVCFLLLLQLYGTIGSYGKLSRTGCTACSTCTYRL